MTRPEDDAEAPTLVAPGTIASGAPTERLSRPVLDDGLFPDAMIGRYRLKKRLGAGAMGVVWLARDPQLDRDVAIKVVHPSLARTPEASSRLLREARAMAKLSHRSVVTVHDAGEVDGRLFLAMELVQGTTLGNILRSRDPASLVDWRRWLAMMLDAGRGLAEAHRHGVLHRDFKPDNVLVDASERVCVGDFGLATLGEGQPAAASLQWNASTPLDLTSTGALLGTPMYMSPQQLRGETVDARADQFAFCIATHEALYGARPFRALEGLAAIPSLVDAIEAGALPEPPKGSTVPPEIRDVLRRGLSVEPEARWPDMDQLLEALVRASRQRGPTVIRHRFRYGLLGLAALAILGAVAVTVVIVRRDSPSQVVPPIVDRPAARQLFGMALRTRMAVSPDGKRIALGGDGLWIRSVVGGQEWKAELPEGSTELMHLELDEHDARFSIRGSTKRWRWRYSTDNKVVVDIENVGGEWRGTTAVGELVYAAPYTLALVDRNGVAQPWQGHPDVLAISPNKQLVAYIEGGRFTGTVVVRDVTTDRVVRSTQLDEPVALAWIDDTTLALATSTLHEPKIYRATVDRTTITPTSVILSAPLGWYADLGVGGGKLFYVSMPPEPSGRVVELGPTPTREDLGSVSLGLGWDAHGDLLTWNRSMLDIERRSFPGATRGSTNAKLEVEPANATTNGDTLIATLRRPGGRQAVAVSISTGKQLWEHPDKRTLAVRCAGDRAPPCFALREVSEERDQVVSLDPVTGTLGTKVIHEQDRIEDIAVRDDGTHILIVGMGPVIHDVDLATGMTLDHPPPVNFDGKYLPMSVIRSIAYAPGDGSAVFTGGTVGRNRFQVGLIRDRKFTPLDETRDGVLAFVRPSPDGKRIVFIARRYAPQLWELPLAP